MTFGRYFDLARYSIVSAPSGRINVIGQISGKTIAFDDAERSDDKPALDTILQLIDQLNTGELGQLGAYIERKRRAGFKPVVGIDQLTDRENEVLVLVASGYNRKEIGRTLGISACTAAKHIANIYRKLGVSTIAEATRMAMVEIQTPA